MRSVQAVLAASTICGVLTATALGAEPMSIVTVAPKDSIAVVNIPNWRDMRAAFDKTSLARVWREPSVQRWIDEAVENAKGDDAEFAKMMARWREFAEQIDEPTGAVGLAIHMAETKSLEADYPAKQMPHVLMVSDFGPGAENIETEIAKLLHEGVADGELKLEERSEDGVMIYSISFPEDAEDEPAGDEEMEDDEFDFEDFEGPEYDYFKTVHMARVGQLMVVGSHKESFTDCLADVRAERSSGLADEPLFKDSMAQIGAGNHIAGTFMLTAGLRTQIREELSGPMMMPIPIPIELPKLFEELGLTEFKSASLGMKFNTDKADIEQVVGLLAESKKGVFALLETEPTPFNPPAFTPADAVSVGRLTFKFDKLMDVIRNIAGTFPADMKAEIDGALQGFDAQFGPALRALGPNIYTSTTITRPMSAQSESQIWAITCSDEMAVNNALAAMAAQIGAEPRDFQGFQVYDGGFAPVAFGLGAGHVFIGQSEAVENALRSASQPGDGPKLADEPRFRRAVSQLGAQGNAYSFVAGREMIELAYWQIKNAGRMAIEQMREAGIDIPEEDEAEYIDEDLEKWTKNLPPVDDIAKHFGDSVMVVRPTRDGFLMESLTLRPDSAK